MISSLKITLSSFLRNLFYHEIIASCQSDLEFCMDCCCTFYDIVILQNDLITKKVIFDYLGVVSLTLYKIISQNTQCRKPHLWWFFQAETLYVCPKHGLAWLWAHVKKFQLEILITRTILQHRNFERMSWRARETLEKQSPVYW